jgi:LEA14-like dessication related protein
VRAGKERFIFVLIVSTLGVTGCATLEEYVRFEKPSAHVAGVALEGFSLEDVTLAFDVEVTNPYSVALPLVDLDYALSSGRDPFLSGRAELAGTVPAESSRKVSLPATITYARLLETLTGIRPGSVVPYTADLGLSVDAPMVGRIRIPLQKQGEVPVPAVPKVSIAAVKWDELGLNEARGRVMLNVANTNEFPLDLSKMTYTLSVNNSQVVSSAVEEPVSFAADGGEGTIEIPVSFSPINMGLSLFQALMSGEATFTVTGDMGVETPYGPLKMPVEETRRVSFRK